MLKISPMPNPQKYYLLSLMLALALHLSLAIFLSQIPSFAQSLALPNKLSLNLVGANSQVTSLKNNAHKLVEPVRQSPEANLIKENVKNSEIEHKIEQKNEQAITKASPKASVKNLKKSSPHKPSAMAKQSQIKNGQDNAKSLNSASNLTKNANNLDNSNLANTSNITGMPSSQNKVGISRAAKVDFQRGVYPQGSRLRGEEGTCVLLLTISPEAQIIKAELEESSSYPRLDKAALQYALDPLAKHKIEVALLNGQAIEAKIKVNVHFRLEQAL